MINIHQIETQNEKSDICYSILRELPEWFGIEDALVDYVEKVKNMDFFVAMKNSFPIGFVALLEHNSYTSEIYVMGIKKEYHRQKVGSQLIQLCSDVCEEKGMNYLTVKTIDESLENESYAKTRLFYEAMGFLPLEVFPTLWGPESPCLFMAKYLK